jgi:hypothetical protein
MSRKTDFETFYVAFYVVLSIKDLYAFVISVVKGFMCSFEIHKLLRWTTTQDVGCN